MFHALVIIIVILVGMLLFFPSAARWPGAGMAGAVLLHQIMDEMWTLPGDWLWPLLGPFTGHMIPDYIGFYFWIEISSPSEWICMAGSLVIFAKTYYHTK